MYIPSKNIMSIKSSIFIVIYVYYKTVEWCWCVSKIKKNPLNVIIIIIKL